MKKKPALDEILTTNPHLKLKEVLAVLNQIKERRDKIA